MLVVALGLAACRGSSAGHAVDLGDGRMPQTDLSTRFEETTAFRWLEQNAARYHFTLSFPRDNPQGVSYEPWHWRYFGRDLARKIHESGQVPRRYLYVNFETAP